MPQFILLPKSDFAKQGDAFFSLYHSNMSRITSFGGTYEEEHSEWCRIYGGAFTHGKNRHIVLISDDDKFIGFFGYNIVNDTFEMEEIQLRPDYHGKGIFRRLYGFVLEQLPDGIKYVEAYAHKTNTKSIGILTRLGLSVIGENDLGDCCHFRGSLSNLLKWHKSI